MQKDREKKIKDKISTIGKDHQEKAAAVNEGIIRKMSLVETFFHLLEVVSCPESKLKLSPSSLNCHRPCRW